MKNWAWYSFSLSLVAVASATVYLLASESSGFPLDDAWIHQVYARSLGLRGELAFNPGEPSSGSTAPAWSVLLSAAYRFGLNPQIWAYLWGVIFHLGSAICAALLSYRYFGHRGAAYAVGVITILEWHLAWGALSGMEISLFTFISILFLLLLEVNAHPVYLGLTGGIMFLVRPEGLLLAGLYFLKLINPRSEFKAIFRKAAIYVIPMVLLLAPMLAFNLQHGGAPFPNTAYAKYMQWSYPWKITNSLRYLFEVASYFVRGPLMLIAPFAILTAYQAWKNEQRRLIYPIAWLCALIGMYAITLPHLYHHGRYIMPLIPIVIILGVHGLRACATRFPNWRFFWRTTVALSALMVIVLWANGASTYSLQIELLNEQQGDAAEWINAHSPPHAVIATHDIGMMGYFGQRRVIDLAGLITPEIIPVLHDQASIAEILVRENVGYLAVFANYFQPLLSELEAQVIYLPSGTEQLVSMGYEPFIVFALDNRTTADNGLAGASSHNSTLIKSRQ